MAARKVSHQQLLGFVPLFMVAYLKSDILHSLQVASYFNRDNVALPGFRDFFKAASDEERVHAQMLKDYQVCISWNIAISAQEVLVLFLVWHLP
jgi:hypothetical protein